jgi:hypothetical protein
MPITNPALVCFKDSSGIIMNKAKETPQYKNRSTPHETAFCTFYTEGSYRQKKTNKPC